jgi:hypothetical protein
VVEDQGGGESQGSGNILSRRCEFGTLYITDQMSDACTPRFGSVMSGQYSLYGEDPTQDSDDELRIGKPDLQGLLSRVCNTFVLQLLNGDVFEYAGVIQFPQLIDCAQL